MEVLKDHKWLDPEIIGVEISGNEIEIEHKRFCIKFSHADIMALKNLFSSEKPAEGWDKGWPSESRFRDMEPGIIILEPHEKVMPKPNPPKYKRCLEDFAEDMKRVAYNLVDQANLTRPLPKPLDDVVAELERANAKNGRFHSPHEAFAVLKEEVDELWDEVRSNIFVNQRAEAVQVAAMAIKFIHFLDSRKAVDPCTTMATCGAYSHQDRMRDEKIVREDVEFMKRYGS